MAEQLCPQCKTPNRVSARFCVNCGEPLLFDIQRRETEQFSMNTKPDSSTDIAEEEVVLAGRYRLERELGRGGFGAVYEALDLNLNRRCALKENLDTSPDAFRQFVREASVLANLSHPNLPRVTDHFTIPNRGQYLVMDFIDGEDLENLIKRTGRISVDQALFWAYQVIDALEYLHEQPQPVLHRDIKPANIRVTLKNKAVLVDFGLVKLYDPRGHTTLGARAVTPGFAPPEQYGTGKTDVRSDIYALGATLYTVITGTEPLESVQRIQGQRQPPAHILAPEVSPALSQVIDQSMALNPSERFQSVTEFRSALRSAITTTSTSVSEPLKAPPTSKPTSRPRDASIPSPSRPVSAAPSKPLPAPERKKQWLSTASIAVAAILCIGVIGIISSISYLNSQSPASITQTVQSQKTMSVLLFATQTAQQQIIIKATEMAAPDSLLLTTPAVDLPAWPEKFADGFDGPNTTFWVGTDTAHPEFGRISAALANGAYHLELGDAKRSQAYWWTKSPGLQTGSDFILTYSGEVMSGAADAVNGIVFHLDAQSGRFYLFGLNRAQEFGVWKVENNTFTALYGPEANTIVNTGRNQLIVWAQSGSYRFIINGSQVAELTDASFSGGDAGMYFAVGSNVSAAFNADQIDLKTP